MILSLIFKWGIHWICWWSLTEKMSSQAALKVLFYLRRSNWLRVRFCCYKNTEWLLLLVHSDGVPLVRICSFWGGAVLPKIFVLDLHQSILHCIALMNCTWLLRPFLLMIKNQQLEGLTIILLTMISICMFKSRILRSHAIVLLTMILLRMQFYKYNTDND